MRRHLITLVLTTSTLVSTDAVRLSTPSGNKDSAHLSRREPSPASGLNVLDRRNYISRSPLETGFIKRGRKSRYTARDRDKQGDKDEDDSSDGEYEGGDDHPEGSWDGPQPPTQSRPPHDNGPHTKTFTTSTTTLTSSMTTIITSPSEVSSSTTPIATPTQTPQTGLNTGVSDGGGSLSPTDTKGNGGNDHDGDENNNGDDHSKTVKVAAISVSIIGGLLLILILLLAWYWFAVRPRRRARLTGQHMVRPKDSDLESHVTVDLRNGPGSSTDGLSSHAMSTGTLGRVPTQGQQHVVAESAARSLSNLPPPSLAQAEPYAAATRNSPTMHHTPFTDAYAAPYPAYSQDPAGSYSLVKSPQGGPSPLRTDAFPRHVGSASTAMELDGRPPPPRYPDAIAAAQVPGSSPTSPLPVSPLSPISPHLGPHALTTDEPQYHPQQYQGPRRPSYGDYEPSSLPEVVSPICQLGQTSASLPEYDESAEAARSGASHHNNLVSQHHLQGGDEKQALSSQQPMPRY
ncbi:hypothetical protein F4680DRAFT_248398 [Xylaria scruposa]|nr:hypothetical protein F4680DRAFT_248398 [Xylaria scruposa]